MSPFVRHFLRLDPRSLGLFRVLFGISLLIDLAGRFDQRTAFYSNEGVLPNHQHLYNLKNAGRFVWSAFHAFNTPGEAAVGMAVIGIAYFLFTIGWKTRAMHAVSLVGLVSLVGRNLLLEGPGEPLALAFLLLTLMLPLGSAFSVDALLAKIDQARETKPKELFDEGALYTDAEVQAGRRPGWSPISVAALGSLLLVALVFLSLARGHGGAAWRDGSALDRALHIYMFASPLGFSLRGSSLLGPLTHLLRAAEWAVPVLLFVPVARGITRGVAAAMIAIYGLSFALLSNFPLFGLTILSAAALVLAHEGWDRWATKANDTHRRTVIYDVDCGICFWLCKMLRRFDTRKQLVMQGNHIVDQATSDEPEVLITGYRNGAPIKRALPKGIDAALTEKTVVAVRPDGSFATRGQAVAEVLRALPGGELPALLISLPVLSALRDWAYDAFAKRRTSFSVAWGLAACGVPTKDAATAPLKDAVSPFESMKFRVLTVLREALGAFVLLALLTQTSHTHDLGFKLPQVGAFESFTWWSRATSKWMLLSPEPMAEHGGVVVDAITNPNPQSERYKALAAQGKTVEAIQLDPLNGGEAKMTLSRPFRLGSQWALYLDRIQREEFRVYQTPFKTYIGKRGPAYDPEEEGQRIFGADVYWLSGPTSGEGLTARRLFRHARGGTKLIDAFNAISDKTAPRPRELPQSPRDEEEPEQRAPLPVNPQLQE